ncbi:MAG: chromate transporter [Candidatus Omnitrophota bacterium]
MIYWQIFLSFFKIGLFAIGGAYSFLPLTEKEVVEKYHWLSKAEFLNLSGMVKIFPGAISIKYATYTGYKTGGILGVLIANFANLLAPTCLVIFAGALANRYKDAMYVRGIFKTIQLTVFAMIIATAFKAIELEQLKSWLSIIIVIAAFCLFVYTKIEPAIIIIVSGLLGLFLSCRW